MSTQTIRSSYGGGPQSWLEAAWSSPQLLVRDDARNHLATVGVDIFSIVAKRLTFALMANEQRVSLQGLRAVLTSGIMSLCNHVASSCCPAVADLASSIIASSEERIPYKELLSHEAQWAAAALVAQLDESEPSPQIIQSLLCLVGSLTSVAHQSPELLINLASLKLAHAPRTGLGRGVWSQPASPHMGGSPMAEGLLAETSSNVSFAAFTAEGPTLLGLLADIMESLLRQSLSGATAQVLEGLDTCARLQAHLLEAVGLASSRATATGLAVPSIERYGLLVNITSAVLNFHCVAKNSMCPNALLSALASCGVALTVAAQLAATDDCCQISFNGLLQVDKAIACVTNIATNNERPARSMPTRQAIFVSQGLWSQEGLPKPEILGGGAEGDACLWRDAVGTLFLKLLILNCFTIGSCSKSFYQSRPSCPSSTDVAACLAMASRQQPSDQAELEALVSLLASVSRQAYLRHLISGLRASLNGSSSVAATELIAKSAMSVAASNTVDGALAPAAWQVILQSHGYSTSVLPIAAMVAIVTLRLPQPKAHKAMSWLHNHCPSVAPLFEAISQEANEGSIATVPDLATIITHTTNSLNGESHELPSLLAAFWGTVVGEAAADEGGKAEALRLKYDLRQALAAISDKDHRLQGLEVQCGEGDQRIAIISEEGITSLMMVVEGLASIAEIAAATLAMTADSPQDKQSSDEEKDGSTVTNDCTQTEGGWPSSSDHLVAEISTAPPIAVRSIGDHAEVECQASPPATNDAHDQTSLTSSDLQSWLDSANAQKEWASQNMWLIAVAAKTQTAKAIADGLRLSLDTFDMATRLADSAAKESQVSAAAALAHVQLAHQQDRSLAAAREKELQELLADVTSKLHATPPISSVSPLELNTTNTMPGEHATDQAKLAKRLQKELRTVTAALAHSNAAIKAQESVWAADAERLKGANGDQRRELVALRAELQSTKEALKEQLFINERNRRPLVVEVQKAKPKISTSRATVSSPPEAQPNSAYICPSDASPDAEPTPPMKKRSFLARRLSLPTQGASAYDRPFNTVVDHSPSPSPLPAASGLQQRVIKRPVSAGPTRRPVDSGALRRAKSMVTAGPSTAAADGELGLGIQEGELNLPHRLRLFFGDEAPPMAQSEGWYDAGLPASEAPESSTYSPTSNEDEVSLNATSRREPSEGLMVPTPPTAKHSDHINSGRRAGSTATRRSSSAVHGRLAATIAVSRAQHRKPFDLGPISRNYNVKADPINNFGGGTHPITDASSKRKE
eukprot:GILI01010515.1.p1 GENE.GILI01010515.1~~GILI01010515.1.p1  ORF type:complete len:1264 (+),score=230.30 GILI01010515.1:23-3814(+)